MAFLYFGLRGKSLNENVRAVLIVLFLIFVQFLSGSEFIDDLTMGIIIELVLRRIF